MEFLRNLKSIVSDVFEVMIIIHINKYLFKEIWWFKP